MPTSVTRIVTARDRLAIGITQQELEETIQRFLDERDHITQSKHEAEKHTWVEQ